MSASVDARLLRRGRRGTDPRCNGFVKVRICGYAISMEKILTDPTILNWPWATLVTLACGYIGYFIAHVGVRDHHKQIDVAFSTLVFGFVSAFGYDVSRRLGIDILVSAICAAIVACLSG